MTAHRPTRVIALLGDPVAHSLSPKMQNAAFRAAGLDATYIALACGPDDLPGLMRTLVRNGGGGNITLPHKGVAAGVGTPDARVERLGAANVFGSGADGTLVVRNTDVDGILALVGRLGVAARTWGVVGTGGSARAVAGAAHEAGVALGVRSRDPERAAEFERWIGSHGGTVAPFAEAEIVINATPLGLGAGDEQPLDLSTVPHVRGVLDLTYRADGPTSWVQAARAAGLAAEDGREMLIVQGAAAWSVWFPGVAAPVEVMRAALAGWLG